MVTLKITHHKSKEIQIDDVFPLTENFRFRVLRVVLIRPIGIIDMVETECECDIVGELSV